MEKNKRRKRRKKSIIIQMYFFVSILYAFVIRYIVDWGKRGLLIYDKTIDNNVLF